MIHKLPLKCNFFSSVFLDKQNFLMSLAMFISKWALPLKSTTFWLELSDFSYKLFDSTFNDQNGQRFALQALFEATRHEDFHL